MTQSATGSHVATTEPSPPAHGAHHHPYTWPLLNPLGIVGLALGVGIFAVLYGFFMRVVPAVWGGATGWLALLFFLYVAVGMVLLLDNKRPYPDRGDG